MGLSAPALYITPDGHVALPQSQGSFSSPSVNTTTLNMNGTNISILYQTKADMTNYITSGTLTNYVNITGNQTITGKKSFAGGINTKSQIVSGTTDLNDDILLELLRLWEVGIFAYHHLLVMQGVEYRFIVKLTAL